MHSNLRHRLQCNAMRCDAAQSNHGMQPGEPKCMRRGSPRPRRNEGNAIETCQCSMIASRTRSRRTGSRHPAIRGAGLDRSATRARAVTAHTGPRMRGPTRTQSSSPAGRPLACGCAPLVVYTFASPVERAVDRRPTNQPGDVRRCPRARRKGNCGGGLAPGELLVGFRGGSRVDAVVAVLLKRRLQWSAQSLSQGASQHSRVLGVLI